MKKILFSAVALLCITILFSCKKNNDNETVSNNQNYLQKLNSLSVQYKDKINGNGTAGRAKWMKILAADLKGALTGAGTGAAAGALIGGVGAGPGAVVGGIVGGAAGSLDAAAAVKATPTASANFNAGNTTGNGNNPFNFVGYHHYQCINQALVAADNYTENGEYSNSRFYNFSTNYLLHAGVVQSLQLRAYSLSDCNNDLALVQANEFGSLGDFVNLFGQNDAISADAQRVLQTYFECLEVSVSENDFVNYSIEAENIVVGSTLSSFDKQVVLGTMSTGRYGTQYWGLR